MAKDLAERAGFEPARGVNPYAISSRAHSSTLAPLRRTPDCHASAIYAPAVSARNLL